MQSNTNSSQKQTIRSALSSSKNISADISKLSQEFIYNVPHIFRTAMLQTRKLSKPYRTWLGWMSAFTSILTLDQMILRSFSIQLDFWYPHVVVATFFSTTLLWLLVVSEGKMQRLHSTTSPPDLK